MSETLPRLFTELNYCKDSSALFQAVRDLAWPIFLDSANTRDGRYDIIAAAPFITLETSAQKTTISVVDEGNVQTSDKDPFSLLTDVLNRYPQQNSFLPFCGGAIGYFGYDLSRRVERLATIAKDEEAMPEMAVGIYDWVIINDHQQQRCYLASHGVDKNTEKSWPLLINRLEATPPNSTAEFKVSGELNTNLDKSDYHAAFKRIQHYIKEGDCYQVNLAKRFEIAAEGDSWAAYQLLRQYNSAPFSAYFKTPSTTILSSSPERLLKVNDAIVETKPIKGTRPRNLADLERDQQLKAELQNSLKDRAENLMIVDLLRNDLGKVCQPGSIAVPKLFSIESFATVHHLVSTVTGLLAEGQSAVSLLRACFPGGSITGAPKLRAMEIIEELEPNRRGAYCGSIAYIGFDGKMDSNITIRTLVYNNNSLRFWAGGGIVADSDVEAEYQEVLDKAAAIFTMLEKLR
jgi:para-aminobenzoate synthetase component 1